MGCGNERTSRSLIKHDKGRPSPNGVRDTHGLGEAASADVRWGHLLHQVHEKRREGEGAECHGIVGWSRISDHSFEVPV